jgi:hypothetical protein
MPSKYQILSFVLLLIVSLSWGQVPIPAELNDPVFVQKNSLSISVDPRIELLSIVQYLSNYGKKHNMLVTRFDHIYRTDADKWFSAFKNHPAIEMFNLMSSRGFSYDAPPTTMLYLGPDFSFDKAIYKIPQRDLWARAGGELQLTAFVNSLKAFAKETNFSEFYRNHRSFYDRITRETAAFVPDENVIQQLEKYYGEKRNSYTVIISPLIGMPVNVKQRLMISTISFLRRERILKVTRI